MGQYSHSGGFSLRGSLAFFTGSILCLNDQLSSKEMLLWQLLSQSFQNCWDPLVEDGRSGIALGTNDRTTLHEGK